MKHYTVIGAGGTGSHLLPMLLQYLRSYHHDGKFLLHIVDGDVVEEKNLERQRFNPAMVTLNKAVAAAGMLNDSEHVVAHPEYATEGEMDRWVRDGDTIFICADNFTVRAYIEGAALGVDNVTVINGGNEEFTGSVQLWVREKGENITPRIGYLHPEIRVAEGEDRAAMTCIQAAALPGGEQTMVANMTAAMWMFHAIWRRHNNLHVIRKGEEPSEQTWTELQFNARTGEMERIDQRLSSHWRKA